MLEALLGLLVGVCGAIITWRAMRAMGQPALPEPKARQLNSQAEWRRRVKVVRQQRRAAVSTTPAPAEPPTPTGHSSLDRIVRFLKQSHIASPALIAILLLAADLLHIHFSFTRLDYASISIYVSRFILSFATGYALTWIHFIARQGEPHIGDLSSSARQVIKYLALAALFPFLLLLFYVEPPPPLSKLMDRLTNIEGAGVKIQLGPGGPGLGSNGGRHAFEAAASDKGRSLNAAELPTPYQDIIHGHKLLTWVAARIEPEFGDEPYFEQTGTRYTAPTDSIRLFAAHLAPTARCLSYLKHRDLVSPGTDKKMGRLGAGVSELLRQTFSNFKKASTGEERFFVRTDERIVHAFSRQLSRLILELSQHWLDLARRQALTGIEWNMDDRWDSDSAQRGGPKDCQSITRIGRHVQVYSARDRLAAAAISKQRHEIQTLIQRTLGNLDIRRDHLPIVSAFLSLYVSDRVRAVEQLDLWVTGFFRPLLGDTRNKLSAADFRKEVSSFCAQGHLSVSEETSLLTCLTFARIRTFQFSILNLYHGNYELKNRRLIQWYDDIPVTMESLIKRMAGADRKRRSDENCLRLMPSALLQACMPEQLELVTRCRSGEPTCPSVVLKALGAIYTYRNNWVWEVSHAPELPISFDSWRPKADEICRDILADQSRGVRDWLARSSRRREIYLRAVWLDTCTAWELRRTELSLQRLGPAAEHVGVNEAQRSDVEKRLKDLFKQLSQAAVEAKQLSNDDEAPPFGHGSLFDHGNDKSNAIMTLERNRSSAALLIREVQAFKR